MMAQTDGLDFESQVMDQDRSRDKQLMAVLVLRTLIERTDLPVLEWDMQTRQTVQEVPKVELIASPFRTSSFLRGGKWHKVDRGRIEREAMRRWSTAFNAEIVKQPTDHGERWTCEFTYAGVPVKIRITFAPEE